MAILTPRTGIADGVPDFDAIASAITDPTWFLREDNFEPAIEHELESRFSVGNGFIGIRGSLDFPAEASSPRSYVAGFFDLRPGPPPLSALVPAPPAFAIRLSINGELLGIGHGKVRRHTRLLDYGSGTLHSIWQQGLPSGRTVSLESLRFTSLSVHELAVHLLRFRFDGPAQVVLQPQSLDQLVMSPTEEPSIWRTGHGAWAIACLREIRLQADATAPSRWLSLPAPGITLQCHKELSLLQLTSYGLRERPGIATAQAQRALAAGKRSGIRGLRERHVQLWQKRWQASDIVIDGDEEAQRGLRFAVYHLNSAVDPKTATVSVAARGLTGDGYMGHVFWDTEIFMLPFYTLSWPEAARSLLEYRHRTLPASRTKARRLGFGGALYAWESTDTGEEATPPYAIGPRGQAIAIRNGDLEQHVSAAVAFAVWQYWQATHDVDFLLKYGAEMVLETCRFWASRFRQEADGLYHIRGVIGPDEYHEDVDDNAYTNYMARWNIQRGLEVATLVKRRWPQRWRELSSELALTAAELESWRSVSSATYLPYEAESGILEQFTGYSGLEFIDLSAFPKRTAPIDVLLGPERTRRSQAIKQADVLMLMALLPDAFPLETQRLNFEYYEPRCGHGSSLSPPVHSILASRLGCLDLAERYFRQTASIDLNDSMGNSAAGLHLGALGGLWQAAVFGFGGLSLREDGLAFNPRLLPGWRTLRFPLQWRQRHLVIELSGERQLMQVALKRGRPMTIYAGGSAHRLEQGRPLVIPLPATEEVRP
ncbi:MAG TPA: glycosyl hydrolase family 65 protein [Dehalococcoidia bacterium]|nr:glycosyl hydrolase family 65 protein [Dehalococcoidia bacterium]